MGFGHTHSPAQTKNVLLREEDAESHLLVVGGTGSGKSRSFVIPQLLSYKGGVVCFDTKGELFQVTHRHRRSIGPVLPIDPFCFLGETGGGGLNLLSLLSPKSPTLIDDVYALASLFKSGTAHYGHDGEFWSDWGVDVIAGMLCHVVCSAQERDRSLGRVYERLSTSDLVYDLAVLLDQEAPSPFTLSTLGKFISLPEITRGGVLATFAQQIRLLASASVRRSLATNSIDLSAIIAGEPFTIYLIWPPDKLHSHAALIRIFLHGITNLLLRRRHQPKHRTLFLLEEAAAIGRVPSLISATTLGRAFGIKVAWVFQTIAQMRHAYGPEAQVILDNCATAISIGRAPNWSAAQALMDTVFGDVPAERIFAMSQSDVLIRQAGAPSAMARKLDYLTDPVFRGRFDGNALHCIGPQSAERGLS